MKNIFIILLTLSFAFSFGQNKSKSKEKPSKEIDYTKIFTSVQVQAEPPGGMNAFRQFIGSSFRLPVVSKTTIGTIVVRFVVWNDGTIRDINIIKETPSNLGLGKEAIRVLKSCAKWKPGIFAGRPVKQYYTLPISIQITQSESPIRN